MRDAPGTQLAPNSGAVRQPDAINNHSAIGVVIVTRNEERNLSVALRSVAGWTNEVVVVDMESSDRTVEIADKYGARVFPHAPVGFPEPAWAFGIAQTTSDWVLILDADELVTPRLATQIRAAVERATADVVWLPFSNYLFGRRMRGSSWSDKRSRHIRLFRPESVTLSDRIHLGIAPAAGARVEAIAYRAGTCVIHFNYTSIRQFIDKTNRYTSIEAGQTRASAKLPSGRLTMVARPLAEFFNQWLLKQGFRDGWSGFYIAALMAFYRFAERAKLRELVENGDEAQVERLYARLAEEWLSGRVPD